MKKAWIFFGVGLLTGTIVTNLLKVGFIRGIWDYPIIIDAEQAWPLFIYIWKQRMTGLVIMWLMSFTIFCLPVICGYTAFYGFSVSVMISALTIEQGIKSIFLYLGMCFPQMLIYVPVWIYFAQRCISENDMNKETDRFGRKKNITPQLMKWGLSFLIVMVAYSGGVALEAFVNPWFITRCLSFVK